MEESWLPGPCSADALPHGLVEADEDLLHVCIGYTSALHRALLCFAALAPWFGPPVLTPPPGCLGWFAERVVRDTLRTSPLPEVWLLYAVLCVPRLLMFTHPFPRAIDLRSVSSEPYVITC